MIKKKEVTPIEFQLDKMELIGIRLDIPQGYIPSGKFGFDISLESRLDRENSEIAVTVEILVKDGERIVIGSLSSRFWFNVNEFEKLITKDKEGRYILPQSLESSMNAISISTTRGMMYAAFRGTILNDVILPVIGSI